MTDQEQKQLKETTRVRVLLESEAVAEIARHPDRLPEVRKKLTPFIPQVKAFISIRDYAAFHQADHCLHRNLIELAGNPLLLKLWDTVWEAHATLHRDRIEMFWPDLRVVVNEHVYLIETVCSGDATAALEALRSHLEAIIYRVKECHAMPPSGDLLEGTCAWLACHMHQSISLQEVARKVAFVSPGHLSRMFRQRYGMGFNAFVRRLKMDKAEHLLKHSQLPIHQIALRCGYASASRFCEHFKRMHGKTPHTFRTNQ